MPSETPPPRGLGDLADHIAMLDAVQIGERYSEGKVPVLVVDVTGRGGRDLAVGVEAAENNVRRQYSREEIVALAKRFSIASLHSSLIGDWNLVNLCVSPASAPIRCGAVERWSTPV